MSWNIDQEDLKRYPHFDKHLPISEILAIVLDPSRVKSNAFYPFIEYEKSFQPYRAVLLAPDKKTRKIRYASRRDSYIYSYYRHLLTLQYEPELARLGINQSVIAYRKIPIYSGSDRCRCNIDFAKEAFDFIKSAGDCSAIVLDIRKYFESLDHAKLRQIWCRILNVADLPADHAVVFQNITNYRYVDKNELHERICITKKVVRHGVSRIEEVVPFNKIPTQICSNADFREKVTGCSGRYKSLIKKNDEPYGIPQGSPISDVLANMYLIDFDVAISNYVDKFGGLYRRYSDDIIIIIPGKRSVGIDACSFVKHEITLHGDRLEIPDKKASVSHFSFYADGRVLYEHISGSKGKNGLEYLGFRFDGKNIYLRDATVSSLFRKMSSAIKREAHALRVRYPGKDAKFLFERFNVQTFIAKFGRVEDFDSSEGCRGWTFWTYARRAQSIFGAAACPLYKQLRSCRGFIQTRMSEAITKTSRSASVSI